MKNFFRSPLFVALLVVSAALILPLRLSSDATAEIVGSFELGIDQNLIYLNGIANRKNLAAAITDAEAINNQQRKNSLEDSLERLMGEDLRRTAMSRSFTNTIMDREYPGMLLSNQASSNSNITSIEILLSKPLTNFRSFTNGEYLHESVASGEYYYFPNLPELTREYVDPDQIPISANIFNDGKGLAVSFGNEGIQPGRAMTFNVYSSMGIQLEDFFDEDSQITVVYEDPLTNDVASTSALNLSGINVFNDALMAQLAGGINGRSFRKSVEAFSFTASIGAVSEPTSTIPFPEPTSLMLLSCGVGCLAKRSWRNYFCEKQCSCLVED